MAEGAVPVSGVPLRFETLDSLRGLAAFTVVIAHCCMMLPKFSDYGLHYVMPPIDWSDPLAFLLIRTPLRVVWLGRGPVALFFVLSGFVLSLPWLRGRPPSYAVFAIRRFCRIYLPYIAAVMIAALFATVLAPYRPAPQSEWFDRLNWTEPFTIGAAVSHLLMLGTHNTFDNAIWSLIHEMRISLVFPLLILPLLRWRILSAAALVVGLIASVALILRLAGGDIVLGEIAGSLQYSALFVMGAATAQYAPPIAAWLARTSPVVKWVFLLAGLLTLSVQWPILPAYFQGLGGVCIIIAALAPGALAVFLHQRILRKLGHISYSLYLIHLPVLLSAVYLLHPFLPIGVILIGVPPTAVAVAWIFNRLVEDPAAELGRRIAARLRPVSLAAVIPPM